MSDELMDLVEPDYTEPPMAKPVGAHELVNGVHAYECAHIPTNAPPLANGKDPYYTTQRERYTHRIMLECAAKGMTVKEIAEYTGFTTICVNNILRQKHVQQTLVNEIQRLHGVDDEVVEVIKRNVVASVKLYEEVLNDPKQDIDRKLSVADRFVNRRYGKPTQPLSQGSAIDLNSLSDDELAKLLTTRGTGSTH